MPGNTVEQIKARLTIVEVVGSYLKLDQAGINFRARCPFHNEKTPSFYVSPERNTYHCFGCQRGGDIFSFVQEMEGLDFLGALKVLADRAGVAIRPLSPEQKNETETLRQLLQEATDFYVAKLSANQEVLSYLQQRGLQLSTIKEFSLGFAPPAWRLAYDFLSSRGYTKQQLMASGMVVCKASSAGHQAESCYDRFRSRIMFPLRDSAGRTIAFSGRIFGQADTEVAKYLNSPQTVLFDKSNYLYGYDQAKNFIRQADQTVLVEGQLDLLLSHQAGVKNTVATSGTALTTKHLSLLKRLSDNLVLAYDGDRAGINASRSAILLARQADLNVRIVKLPSGQDPADVVNEQASHWTQAVATAPHYVDFLLLALQEEGRRGLDLNLEVRRQILPFIKSLSSKMEQDYFIGRLANLLAISEQAIRDDVRRAPGLNDQVDLTAEQVSSAEVSAGDAWPSLLSQRAYALWSWRAPLDSSPEEKTFWADFLEKLSALSQQLHISLPTNQESLVWEAEALFAMTSDFKVLAEELINKLKLEQLKIELNKAMTELKKAETSGMMTVAEERLSDCQKLNQDISHIKNILNKQS